MNIWFRYEIADSTIQQRWINSGEATVKRQDFSVAVSELPPAMRQLILDLGFKLPVETATKKAMAEHFEMKHGEQRILFGSSSNFIQYLQLPGEITTLGQLNDALYALKGKRDAETAHNAALKAKEEADKAQRAADLLAAQAATRQRKDAAALAAKAKDAARTDWIVNYGSEHLRLLWAERSRFDTAYHLYEQERAAIEYPGCIVDIFNCIESNKMELPSAEALKWLKYGLSDEVRALSHIVDVYHSRGNTILDSGEAIEINDPLYTYRIYHKVVDYAEVSDDKQPPF